MEQNTSNKLIAQRNFIYHNTNRDDQNWKTFFYSPNTINGKKGYNPRDDDDNNRRKFSYDSSTDYDLPESYTREHKTIDADEWYNLKSKLEESITARGVDDPNVIKLRIKLTKMEKDCGINPNIQKYETTDDDSDTPDFIEVVSGQDVTK